MQPAATHQRLQTQPGAYVCLLVLPEAMARLDALKVCHRDGLPLGVAKAAHLQQHLLWCVLSSSLTP